MTDGPFGRRSDPLPPEDAARPDELAARSQPGPRPGPPAPPAGISSITWILGVAVVLALAYITLNTLQTDAPGSRGIGEGEPLPAFAAPIATSTLQGDAQVDPEKACGVRGERVLNSCELAEGGPVALAFLATRSRRCQEQIDLLDRVRARHPDVRVAAVAIRGGRDEVAGLVRRRRWRLPVAHDRDGAVANLYAVAVCPTITFAGADGRVTSTSLGFVSEAELERRLREIDR